MLVEMFKVRMQGQYGSADDKKLRAVFSEVAQSGFRKGIMRGYWVPMQFASRCSENTNNTLGR